MVMVRLCPLSLLAAVRQLEPCYRALGTGVAAVYHWRAQYKCLMPLLFVVLCIATASCGRSGDVIMSSKRCCGPFCRQSAWGAQ